MRGLKRCPDYSSILLRVFLGEERGYVLSCKYCNHEIPPSSQRTMKSIQRRRAKMNRNAKSKKVGLLTSLEIKQIRDQIGITQEEFSKIFHRKRDTFAQYERGNWTQSRYEDRLLKQLAKGKMTIEDIIWRTAPAKTRRRRKAA